MAKFAVIVLITFLMLTMTSGWASARYSITLGYVHNNPPEYYLQTSLISLVISASSYRGYNTINRHGFQTTIDHILFAATGLQQSNSIVSTSDMDIKIYITIIILSLIMKFKSGPKTKT